MLTGLGIADEKKSGHVITEMEKCYTLLVTFSAWPLSETDASRINLINTLPYDGVALPLIGTYEESKSWCADSLRSLAEALRNRSRAHVWPWVFLNRIIAPRDQTGPLDQKPGISHIKLIDLQDKHAAFSQFLTIFDQALNVARTLGSPGIFLDPEFYSAYNNNDIYYLAKNLGIEPQKAVEDLRSLGAHIADHIEAHYSDAIVWAAFTGMSVGHPALCASYPERWRTVTWIFDGMLGRAKDRRYSFKVVSGGEWFPGYCYTSFVDLIEGQAEAHRRIEPYLKKYPNLRLGATIAPWVDSKLRTGYFGTGSESSYKCRGSKLEKAEDFIPLLRNMMWHSKYLWIYGASGAGFLPFTKEGKRLNDIIRKVIQN